MTTRGLLAAALPIVLSAPQNGLAQGQGVAIDHKEVKCIVAEKYTRMSSCFDPQANLARGRVYFRAAGTQPWYFVEFKSDTPCFTTFLPKAKPEIQKVDYYVEGLARDSSANRTADFDPIVVKREEDCKDRPVAPFVNKATVVVGAAAGGPVVPFGFVTGAGIGSTAVVGGLLAAGVVGGAVALSTGDNNTAGTPPVTPPGPPVTPPPPTTGPPPTSGPPPTQPYQFVPAFAISPDPPVGTEPMKVVFDMCASRGEGLRFRFDFDGDGATDQAGTACSASRTYTTGGVSASGRAAVGAPTTLAPRKSFYATQMSVSDDRGNNAGQTNTVEVVEALKTQDSPEPARRLAWASELNLEGGSGQVVVNGTAAVFAPKGRSAAVAVGRRGENRVEAVVVEAAGKAGTWRLELGGTTSFKSGSLRVVSGDVALLTADAIVFRLDGKPGERLMFTFRTDE